MPAMQCWKTCCDITGCNDYHSARQMEDAKVALALRAQLRRSPSKRMKQTPAALMNNMGYHTRRSKTNKLRTSPKISKGHSKSKVKQAVKMTIEVSDRESSAGESSAGEEDIEKMVEKIPAPLKEEVASAAADVQVEALEILSEPQIAEVTTAEEQVVVIESTPEEVESPPVGLTSLQESTTNEK